MKTRAEALLAALNLEIRSHKGTRAWFDCAFHEEPEDRECFIRTGGPRVMTWHCYSCKAGGAAWELAKKIKRLDEEDAREYVRKLGKGFKPTQVRARVVDRAATLRKGFALPKGIVFAPLESWSTLAREYAIERGLDQTAIDEYRIGYSLMGGHLQGRIVFPVLNAQGRPVSYSARTFVDDEKKYVTPDERENPDKDGIFGQHLWRTISEREILGVTEGAIDAFSVRRATGFDSGALSGSDVRSRHVLAMSTFKTVVFMSDADASGDKAWRRVVASGLGRWTKLRRLRFRAGEDANKIMLSSPARLADEIRKAASLC